MNLSTPLRIRATFDAYSWPDDETDDPDERRGWVDPSNPWGSFEQDTDDDSCEPAAVYLPFAEAVEFLSEFPGGIWGYSESESEQSFRTGEWKSVTAHVDDDVSEILFAALDIVA